MQFGEKLKAARKAAKLSQSKLASQVGVSSRTIQFYELGDREPRKASTILALAHALGVGTDYFFSTEELARAKEQEEFLNETAKRYGSRGRAQAQLLLDQTNSLFAGGELTDEDQVAFFQAITEIYFDAKAKAKKYTPKKYLNSDGGASPAEPEIHKRQP